MTNSNFVGCSTGRCAGVAPPMRKSESQGSFTGERWRRLSCKLAEGEGFEPPRGLRPGGFQEQGRVARNHAVSRNGTELDPAATWVLIGSCRPVLHTRGHNTR